MSKKKRNRGLPINCHRVLNLRCDKGWTQARLAKEVGVHRNTIATAEGSGRNNSNDAPRISRLNASNLAAALGVGLDEIVANPSLKLVVERGSAEEVLGKIREILQEAFEILEIAEGSVIVKLRLAEDDVERLEKAIAVGEFSEFGKVELKSLDVLDESSSVDLDKSLAELVASGFDIMCRELIDLLKGEGSETTPIRVYLRFLELLASKDCQSALQLGDTELGRLCFRLHGLVFEAQHFIQARKTLGGKDKDPSGTIEAVLREDLNEIIGSIVDLRNEWKSRVSREGGLTPGSIVSTHRANRWLKVGLGVGLAASLFILGVCADRAFWPRQNGMQVLVASTSTKYVPGRDPNELLPELAIESDLSGFATVVSLAPERRPLVWPSIGSDDFPIIGDGTSQPFTLPKDTTEAVFVVTETPSGEPIRRIEDSFTDLRPGDESRVRELMLATLKEKGYRRMAFGEASFTPGD